MALACDTCLAQGAFAPGEPHDASGLALCEYHQREFKHCMAGIQLMFRYGGMDKIPTRAASSILMISNNIAAKVIK